MKKLLVAGISASAGMLTFAAMAATDVTSAGVTAPAVVSVPWGGWVQGIAQAVSPYFVSAASTALVAALTSVSPVAAMFFSRSRVEQAVQGVADYAVNATLGATKGKVLDVNVGYSALATGLNYAISSVSASVIKQAGGWENFMSMVFRSIPMGEDATAGKVLAPVIADLKAKGLIK